MILNAYSNNIYGIGKMLRARLVAANWLVQELALQFESKKNPTPKSNTGVER